MADITDNSKISVKLILTVCGLLATIGITLISFVWRIDARLSKVEYRLETLTVAVDSGNSDRWHRRDMAAWARELKAANPAIIVPEVPRD